LNKEIKNIRHDLILNEYPQEFVDSIMKPLRSNRHFSDTVYQGMVIIPYVKGISKKFRHIGNCFDARTIFKTGLVRDAQQMKQCVCTISHVIVADVTSTKQVDLWKYVLRSTNT
jgi:hypothetical protein